MHRYLRKFAPLHPFAMSIQGLPVRPLLCRVVSRGYATSSAKYSGAKEAKQKPRPLRHSYFIGLCALCGLTGAVVGQLVEIDHSKLPNAFIIADIQKDLQVNFDFRPDLAPAMVRLAFLHGLGEALGVMLLPLEGTPAPRYCPSLTVGVEEPQSVVRSLTLGHKISHADTVTLAGVLAVEYLGGPRIHWRCGRKDERQRRREKGASASQPKVPLPSPLTGTLDEWLAVFAAIGFTPQDFVALLGAHGVGGLPYTGPARLSRTKDKYRFNNSYYRTLLATKYKPAAYDTGGVYVGVGADASKHNLGMLPWEAQLSTHPQTAPFVKKFASDEAEWLAHFTQCFTKLLEMGSQEHHLREYIPPPNLELVRAQVIAAKQQPN